MIRQVREETIRVAAELDGLDLDHLARDGNPVVIVTRPDESPRRDDDGAFVFGAVCEFHFTPLQRSSSPPFGPLSPCSSRPS